MKTYEEVKVTEKVKRHIFTTCDLCGGTTKGNWGGGFEVHEVEVRIKEGDTYPEFGSGTEIEYDICPTCFKDKLIPWLESQGAETREREWE